MAAKTLPFQEYSKRLHTHSKKGRVDFRAKFNPGPKHAKKPPRPSGGAPKSQPFDINAPLTAQGLSSNVASAVNLKYGPQIQQLRGSIGQMPGLYEQYRQNLANYQANTAQNYAAQQQASQAAATQTQTNAQGQIDQIGDQERQSAAQRGAAFDPKLLAQASGAGASNAQMQNNVTSQFGKQAANANDYYNRQQSQVLPAQIGQTNLAQARLRNTQGQAADYAQQTRQSIIDSERQFGLNQYLATGKTAQQQAQLQQGEERIGATKRGQTLSHKDRQASLRQKQQSDAYDRQHGLGKYKPTKGGGKGSTPLQKRNAYKTWLDTLNQVRKPETTQVTNPLDPLHPTMKIKTPKDKTLYNIAQRYEKQRKSGKKLKNGSYLTDMDRQTLRKLYPGVLGHGQT